MAKKQCDRLNENKYIYRKVLPMNDNIREMAAEYNLSPVEKDDNEEVKRQKLQLLQELQAMQQQVS